MSERIDSTDSPDSSDDSGVLEPGDSLVDRGVDDVLDEGWSPAERPWASDDWGTTGAEEAAGESLAGRLSRELPDGRAGDDGEDGEDGLGDTADTDGELRDDEVGDVRSGRLVDGEGLDWAGDAGIDGAAASAEEAAVHVVPD